MIKINTTIIFSVVWSVFLIMFSIMAWQSYQSVNTELPRYQYQAPKDVRILAKGADILAVMEGIIKTHNTAVEKLEQSIRSEAKTMAAINFASALLCFLGLFAQVTDHMRKKLRNN